MICAAALSTSPHSDEAFRDVVERVYNRFDGETADITIAFVSPHHVERLGFLRELCLIRNRTRHLIGCSAESVIGDGREVEGAPAVSLWAARLPGIQVTPIRMVARPSGMDALENALATPASGDRTLFTFGDPFSFPVDPWLRGLNEAVPGLRVIGGMASAGHVPGSNRLILDEEVHADGAVAVLFNGDLALKTVVSQGCRPIGRPMIVTRASENLIQELGRRPALEVLKEVIGTLDPRDRDLIQGGLHIGRVINEYQESFGRGDFLVRNVVGADNSGALAISDQIRVGVTVQFHVRDDQTADEDLRSLLESARFSDREVAGALLFTCNGRGTRLFIEPNHDIQVLQGILGEIPTAGFFAMGEIGPIGGQNFVHGFTASVALFVRPGNPVRLGRSMD